MEEKEKLFKEIISKNQYSYLQENEIYLGIHTDLDISMYAKPEFSYQQMEEIRLGLGNGIDVSIYANPGFTHKQMARIKNALIDGYFYYKNNYDKYNGDSAINKDLNDIINILTENFDLDEIFI